jgi:23S rRNA pseudouridine2457 synthase
MIWPFLAKFALVNSPLFQYFAIYKPYGMVSQFSPEGERLTLKDLDYKFPKNVYPLGRLDADSEGLLLLTSDPSVNKKLLDPKQKHKRTYLVMLDGKIDEEKADKLRAGVEISIDGKKWKTSRAGVEIILPEKLPALPEVELPIKKRNFEKISWINISVTEGKNRQIRRMTASLGLPTLRLIRTSIENLALPSFIPGGVTRLEGPEFFRKLRIFS